MSGLYAVAAGICGSSVILAVLSHFVTDGGTKKLLRLVMGAFMVCCIAAPTLRAVGGIKSDLSGYGTGQAYDATMDEAYQKSVLKQTKSSLEQTLADILKQNGIVIDRAEITLALSDETHVIIADTAVYIGAETEDKRDEIISVTQTHFAVTPRVITE